MHFAPAVAVHFNVSTHSRLKAAGTPPNTSISVSSVSTHSRLKAAGSKASLVPKIILCFNTQPPEGGWRCRKAGGKRSQSFNTQPPEGGWGFPIFQFNHCGSFNTQPPEGGWLPGFGAPVDLGVVSTHSRLKAAGCNSA